jgi:hypothetical protein
MKTGKLFILGLIFVLAAAACSPAAKTITVTTEGGKCTLEGGSKVSAGEVTVNWSIKEKTSLIYGLWFLTLNKDKGYEDLVNYVNSDKWATDFPPSWSQWQGDIFPAKPDSQNEKTFTFKDGPLYLVCLSGESSVVTNDEHFVKTPGVLGPVDVVK